MYTLTVGGVPREERKRVYEKALEIITDRVANGREANKAEPNGLCLLLPCILWNLNNYLDDPESGYWDYNDTALAFPEIAEGVNLIKKYDTDKDVRRKKVLEEALSKM